MLASVDSYSRATADYQSQVLEAVGSARNYRAWLCDLALPHLGPDPVEIGSGLGDFAQNWLDRGAPRMTVSEVDPARMERLRSRFGGDGHVGVEHIDMTDPPVGVHASLVAFNVLEHIADDVGALKAARRLVRTGGSMIVFVPAIPAAMSDFDRRIGHARRYTRSTLRAAFVQAGIPVRSIHYVNATGLVAWFVGMRVLGLAPREGPLLRAWDRFVVPATRVLEARIRPPIGLSLLAVGRVPAPTSLRPQRGLQESS